MILNRRNLISGVAAGVALSMMPKVLASKPKEITLFCYDTMNLVYSLESAPIPNLDNLGPSRIMDKRRFPELLWLPLYNVVNSIDWKKKYESEKFIMDRAEQVFDFGFKAKILDDAYETLLWNGLDKGIVGIKDPLNIPRKLILSYYEYPDIYIGINPNPNRAAIYMSKRHEIVESINTDRNGKRAAMNLGVGIHNASTIIYTTNPEIEKKVNENHVNIRKFKKEDRTFYARKVGHSPLGMFRDNYALRC